jgi:hypothetical protein
MLARQPPSVHSSQLRGGKQHSSAVHRPVVRASAASTAPPGQQQQQQSEGVDSAEQQRKKVSFVSLGCPKNVVDGE